MTTDKPRRRTRKASPSQPRSATRDNVVWWKLSDLRPNPRNARSHSPEQIKALRGLMRRFGWTNPILATADGEIVAGHGRFEAARAEGYETAKVLVVDGLSDEEVRAYMLADNAIAERAGWDEALLRVEIGELDALGFDLDLTGFDKVDLGRILGEEQEVEHPVAYSRKIKGPVYEPSDGPPPPLSALLDDSKFQAIVREIREAENLPPGVASFLEKAAERHVVFNFAEIADYYAAADPAVQRLMERSALVIIDFDKAIENGFVRMTRLLGEIAEGAEEVEEAEADEE